MIDPRFANAGAVPLGPGYGQQQVPVHYHRRRHHHHRKNKHGGAGESPLSHDESIHKVDHGRRQFQQNDGVPFAGGYPAPFGTDAFGFGGPGGFFQQQQQQQQPPSQYPGGNYAFPNQYPGNVYHQGQFGGIPTGPITNYRRRHRHHRHHAVEAGNVVDQAQGVPEQLIGQRSSSVIGHDGPQANSPFPAAEGDARNAQGAHYRHRHHRNEYASFGQSHQSRQTQGHTSAGADGYGHINDDLIFIERGEHSPHRQEPPLGYEYKGKIEVQGVDKETRSHSHGHSLVAPPPPIPIPQPQPVAPLPSLGHCPPGWQQMILSAAPGGPCPPGGAMYTGQLVGAAQGSLGAMSGYNSSTGGVGYAGVGSLGTTPSGGGLANLAASLPFPPQGQLVADYIVDSSAGGVSSPGGSTFHNNCQQISGTGFSEPHGQLDQHVTNRATIIEVWQKRNKSDIGEESPTRVPKSDSTFDFERFRNEILGAIERIVQGGGGGNKLQWTGHDGGTQTQIHTGYDDRKETEKRPTASGGEVRVVVQPIQPVFYMPRQTETRPNVTPQVGPAIQQTASGAPNIVYVPRNVYVPVIKPVFVPRERVIVRPQVIHVARPVLVDRPVPVTQRPIIIDRERPVPVPVRGGHAAEAGGSRVVREDFVYRDNLPVAYGGRCADQVGGVNYGYMPAQQEEHHHQYSGNSTHEAAHGYEAHGSVVNVPAQEQYQHSHSNQQINVQQGGGNFHESYTNIAQTSSASGIDPPPLSCTDPIDVFGGSSFHSSGPIEVLDATVNPTWQRTDKSTLVRRYGRSAYDIVQKTDQVEQQMYQELRQRSSSGGIQRSDSIGSYASGSAVGGGGGFVPHGDMQNLNLEGLSHQGSTSIPVSINY